MMDQGMKTEEVVDEALSRKLEAGRRRKICHHDTKHLTAHKASKLDNTHHVILNISRRRGLWQ